MPRGDQETIERVLRRQVWAVVGLTGDPSRPAYSVAQFLLDQGKTVVPVNPGGVSVLGQPGCARLADVARHVDVVDIFRRSDRAGAHVDEAIDVVAGAVWLQLGVLDEKAADRAQAAGLDVVMDRCPKIDWAAYGPR